MMGTDLSQGVAAPPAPEAETLALTLLLVEDDLLSREILLARFAGLFKAVFAAADGDEGYQLFCRHKPDLVLTDQIMPGTSGLDLMRKIRATGAKTPVVLMTSSIDNRILLEAINIGVERFVPKPFNFDLLTGTLNGIAREIVNERLREQHRKQEVELLRYRDSYNSLQQESARCKERNITHHDQRDQIMEGAGGKRWGINVAYSPRDIMCGDGYSVRRLPDGRQLIFVIDAMGSGMSASLTAMLSISFCNYQVENLYPQGGFILSGFLKRFQKYLRCILLEEEVLSCGFYLVDLAQEKVEVAHFALPPLLVRGVDGSVHRVRGENPPLGIFPREFKIITLSLRNVADVLVMTDGVPEAMMANGDSYCEELERDFQETPTLAAFLRRFRNKTGTETLDDLTLLHLRRLDFDATWNWRGEPGLTLGGLSRTIRDFLAALTREVTLDTTECDELEITLTEALTNALEHGCFSIDREEKTRLLVYGAYDETLETRICPPEAGIIFSATLWRSAGKPLLMMEVRDNGPGFPEGALDTEIDPTCVNGRGLGIINRLNDALFIGSPCGSLIILKTLEGGVFHDH
jgi:two-component system, HptB-dependent secretion and biofilm response regulator